MAGTYPERGNAGGMASDNFDDSFDDSFEPSTDRLIANNAAFAAEFDRDHLDVRPSLRLAVVGCMDSRMPLFPILGLEYGEAHLLRNAGGVVTDDVIRSLCVSQRSRHEGDRARAPHRLWSPPAQR